MMQKLIKKIISILLLIAIIMQCMGDYKIVISHSAFGKIKNFFSRDVACNVSTDLIALESFFSKNEFNETNANKILDEYGIKDKDIREKLLSKWQNEGEGWIEYDKYIALMLYEILPNKEKREYSQNTLVERKSKEKSNIVMKLITKMFSQVLSNKEKRKYNYKSNLEFFKQRIKTTKLNGARLDTLIERQSGARYNRAIELITNGIDASVVNKIGQFGMGFQQILQELEDNGDRVIVRTKVIGKDYGICIEFMKKNDKYYIRDKKYKADVTEHGTTVEVKTKRGLDKKEQNELKEYIKEKMEFNRNIKISYTQGYDVHLVNSLHEIKNNRGKIINQYENNNGVVDININDQGYQVIDHGIGMSDEIVYEHFLLPKHTTKEQGKGVEGLLYKAGIKDSNKCEVKYLVSGVVIKSEEIQGLNLPKELIIELPVNTSIPLSRNDFVIDEIVIQGIKNIINSVDINNDELYQVYNGLIQVVRRLEEKTEDLVLKDKIIELKYEMQCKIKEIINKDNKNIFLPNVKGIESIDTSNKPVIYIDEEICPLESISKLGITKEISNFKSSNGIKAYSVKFKKDKDGNSPVYIKFGKIILIDEELYEKNAQTKYGIALLNLLLNFWIGYGEKPEIIGMFFCDEEKQEDKKNDKSDTNKTQKVDEKGKQKMCNNVEKAKEIASEICKECGVILIPQKFKERLEKLIEQEYNNINNLKHKIKELIYRCNKLGYWNEEIIEKYIVQKIFDDLEYCIAKIGTNFYVLKNGKKIAGHIEGCSDIFDLIVVDKDVYCIARIDDNDYVLKNGKKIDGYIEGCSGISDLIVVDKDVYCIAQIDNNDYVLKNGKKIEGYLCCSSISDFIVVGKDVYCTAQIGSNWYLLKNGKKIDGHIDRCSCIHNLKVFDKDVYCNARISNNWYLLKNGKKIEGDIYGYSCIFGLIVVDKDEYCTARIDNNDYVLKNGKKIDGHIEGCSSINDLKVVDKDVYCTAQIDNNAYVLKNGKKIDGHIEGCSRIYDLIVVDKDVYCKAQIGSNWYILKNGKKICCSSMYDLKVVDKDVYCTAQIGSNWYILKNGNKIDGHIEGCSSIYDLIVVDKDVYCKAQIGSNWYILKNGNNIDGHIDGCSCINNIKVVDKDVYCRAEIGSNWYVLKNGQIYNIYQAPTISGNFIDIIDFITDYVNKYLKNDKEKKYKESIIKNGDFELGEIFKREYIQSGIAILGDKFKGYLDKEFFSKEWLDILNKKTNLTNSEWNIYWEFYEYMYEIIEDKKIFERYKERWDLLFLHDFQTARWLLEKLKYNSKYFQEGYEAQQIPDEMKDYVKYFNLEEIKLLEEKKDNIDLKIKPGYMVCKDIKLSDLILLIKRNKNIKNISKNEMEQLKKQEIDTKEILGSVITNINGQKTRDKIFLRETMQNGKDAGAKEIKINQYIRRDVNINDCRELVTSIEDNGTGMEIKQVMCNLLNLENSSKIGQDEKTGFFGIGFWATGLEGDYIEVKTSKGDGKTCYAKIRIDRNSERKIINVIIEELAEYNENYKGTEIKVINKLDGNGVIIAQIKSLSTQRLIKKYGGGLCARYIEYKGEKTNEIPRDKKIGIKYKGQNLELEREILSELKIDNLGTLKITRDKDGAIGIEQQGLYVNELENKWLKYVPKIFMDMIGKKGLVIELPEKVPLVSSRNGIASEEKYLDKLQRGIAIGIMRACIYLYKQKGIKIPDLPEEYLYKFRDVEPQILKDAENIRIGEWNNVDFSHYVDNESDAVKLITYVVDPERGKSLNEIANVIKNGINVVEKTGARSDAVKLITYVVDPKRGKSLHEIANVIKNGINVVEKTGARFVSNINSAVQERIKEKDEGNEEGKIIKDEKKELTMFRELCLAIYKTTKIGFSSVKFYKKQEAKLAHFRPIYNEQTGEITWEIIWNVKHIQDWLKKIGNDNQEELIFREIRETFLEYFMHEYTHTRENELGLNRVLKNLEILKKNNLSMKIKIEECEKLYKKYFVSLFSYNEETGYEIIDINKANVNVLTQAVEILNEINTSVSIADKNIVGAILSEEPDFGIRYKWTHQSTGVTEDSFARIMKGILEQVIRSCTLINFCGLDELSKLNVKLRKLVSNIFENFNLLLKVATPKITLEKVNNIVSSIIENISIEQKKILTPEIVEKMFYAV
jgi:hypothetical protein